MKITTTQCIIVEFDDGSVKELFEQEAKELHSELGKLLSKSYNEKDYPITEWDKDWKTPNVFGPDPNIIYYYNQPTAQPLNEMFTNKNVLKDAYDTWHKADISSFNCNADTINFIKIPTDIEPLNVGVKTMDDNVVTKVGYENGTINGKPAASLFR